MLADALHVTVYWWQSRQMGAETVWTSRERELRSGRQLYLAPLVTYPEAVRLAEAMAVYERQRRWGREYDDGAPEWVSRRWIDWAGYRLGMAEGMERGGYRALRAWTMEHGITTPVAVRRRQPAPPPGYRREHLPLMDPHGVLPERGPLGEVSCLPWRLGTPVTSRAGAVLTSHNRKPGSKWSPRRGVLQELRRIGISCAVIKVPAHAARAGGPDMPGRDSETEAAEVIKFFDQDLRLHRHSPGDLLTLAAHLHERTGGYMKPLSYLICQAAQEAIENGTEAISREVIDDQLVGRFPDDPILQI
ncbi:hypothetical protein ACWCYZ_33570 [Streptomyces virginiae]